MIAKRQEKKNCFTCIHLWNSMHELGCYTWFWKNDSSRQCCCSVSRIHSWLGTPGISLESPNFFYKVFSFSFKKDISIIRTIIEEGRALVLVVSKWDLVKDKVIFSFAEFSFTPSPLEWIKLSITVESFFFFWIWIVQTCGFSQKKTLEVLKNQVSERFSQIRGVKIIPLSGKTGHRVE